MSLETKAGDTMPSPFKPDTLNNHASYLALCDALASHEPDAEQAKQNFVHSLRRPTREQHVLDEASRDWP